MLLVVRCTSSRRRWRIRTKFILQRIYAFNASLIQGMSNMLSGGNFCSAVEIGDEKLMLSITANGII
jgi:hypothetical protein